MISLIQSRQNHYERLKAMRALPSQSLDSKIIKVWRISAIISAVVLFIFLAIGWAVLVFALELNPVLIALIALALLILYLVLELFILPKLRYSRWKYEVNTTEIDILRGIFWRTRTVIPLVRVQNVETNQGPIMRNFGLSEVEIFTAGSSYTIPGLDRETADQLRDRVAVLARIAQEDV